MSDFRNTLRGIVSMLLCSLFFILNDTMVKYGSDELPLGELLLVRSLMATAVVGLFAWWRGVLPRIGWCLNPGVLFRSAGDGGATVLYMLGLVHMPIANASAIGQAFPLAIAAVGALVFKERTDWQSWLSIALGFAGIMLIVRPGGDGFNAWSLLVVLSVGALVVRDMSTRFMGEGGDIVLVVLANCITVSLVGAGMTAFETWQPLKPSDLVITASAAVCLIGGIGFSIDAMLHGDVSTIAPFRYAFMLYALLIGFVVWGDVPDAPTFIGIAVVVGSGVYVVYRERMVRRRA